MWIVIECWPDMMSAKIITDKNGENKVFDTLEDAEREAWKCQDGHVVALGKGYKWKTLK